MKKVISFLALFIASGCQLATAQSAPMGQKGIDRVAREVHHELVLLPYYGVFDNLEYKVSPDGTVTLLGEVANPITKSDAANAIKHIEGVEKVENDIKVLPLSPLDDQVRRAEFRAIYGFGGLNRYAIMAVPSIHIIVDNGHVTLEGVVATQFDKQVAETQAKGVPNVFSVDNHLRVEENSGK